MRKHKIYLGSCRSTIELRPPGPPEPRRPATQNKAPREPGKGLNRGTIWRDQRWEAGAEFPCRCLRILRRSAPCSWACFSSRKRSSACRSHLAFRRRSTDCHRRSRRRLIRHRNLRTKRPHPVCQRHWPTRRSWRRRSHPGGQRRQSGGPRSRALRLGVATAATGLRMRRSARSVPCRSGPARHISYATSRTPHADLCLKRGRPQGSAFMERMRQTGSGNIDRNRTLANVPSRVYEGLSCRRIFFSSSKPSVASGLRISARTKMPSGFFACSPST